MIYRGTHDANYTLFIKGEKSKRVEGVGSFVVDRDANLIGCIVRNDHNYRLKLVDIRSPGSVRKGKEHNWLIDFLQFSKSEKKLYYLTGNREGDSGSFAENHFAVVAALDDKELKCVNGSTFKYIGEILMSDDEKLVAYCASDFLKDSLIVVEITASNCLCFKSEEYDFIESPVFSPDSKQIVFAVGSPERCHVFALILRKIWSIFIQRNLTGFMNRSLSAIVSILLFVREKESRAQWWLAASARSTMIQCGIWNLIKNVPS